MNGKVCLYQKLFNVMSAIDYLQKDDHVQFGQQNYKAISEEKVTMTVRAELIKNKLIVLPVEQEHSREGTITTVNVRYKIVDIETGESEIVVSSGTGADTQDKGVGKAMTYSYKYLFLRLFAIPTGEDPDKVSSAELDHKQQQSRQKKQQGNREINIEQIDEDLAAIEAASNERTSKLGIMITPVIKGRYQAVFGSLDGIEKYVSGFKTEKDLNNELSRRLHEKAKGA